MTDVSIQAELAQTGQLRRAAAPAGPVLTSTVQTVCEGLFGIRPEACLNVENPPGDIVIARVCFTGIWSGVLVVQFGLFEAMHLAHTLLGPAKDILARATDLVAELANMIAGHLTVDLARGVDAAVPEVGVFSSGLTDSGSPDTQVSSSFTLQGGVLKVSFCVN